MSVSVPRAGGFAEIRGGSNEIIYSPAPNFVGVETFDYELSDGMLSDTGRITVTIENADEDAPVARQRSFYGGRG